MTERERDNTVYKNVQKEQDKNVLWNDYKNKRNIIVNSLNNFLKIK